MKNIIYTLLTFTLLVPVMLRSQSIVQVDNGANIDILTGADVCADQRVINGTITGSGTWCVIPLTPNAPQLSSPSYNANGQLLTLNLIWQKSFGAVTYRVQLSTDSLFTALVVNDSAVTDSIRTVSGLSPLTYYWWRVNAKGIGGTSAYSVVYKFKTLGYPNQVALINPPNNAVNQPVSVQFRWGRASEQTGPFELSDVSSMAKKEIQESTSLVISEDPSSNIEAIGGYWFELVTDTVSMASLTRDTTLTDTTKSISGFTNNTTYFWRVKAKNLIGWGAFSAWWRFTTIVAAPPPPLLVSPPNNATGQNLSLTLVWNKSFSASTYRVQVATDSLFSGLIVNDSTLTDSTRTISGLNPLTYYWWRVNAKNIGGTSTYSTAFKFKTLGNPNQVALINPPNNSVNQPLTIQFRWSRATEQTGPFEIVDKIKSSSNKKENINDNLADDIDAIGNYWFELVTDTVSMSNLNRDTTFTDTTKSVSGLSNLTDYYWRVKAKNQIGWGVFSVWWRFTTIVAAPLTPVLVSPPNNATSQPLSLNLVWHASTYAATYHVQLSTNSGFTSFIINDSTITDTTRAVSGLSQTTAYYWRVRAKNIGGTSSFSPTWSFITMSLVPNLTLKVYLEGFYSPEPLDNFSKKPNSNHSKNGINDEIQTQVEDTLRIYLADSLQSYALVDSVTVYLPSTGSVTTPFTGISTGKYYIIVKHRNHLETWSKYGVSFTGGGTTTYDFTTGAGQAYGDNMKQVGSVWVIYGGDPNQDGEIGALDIPIFISEFGTQGYLSCDFNGDGDVTGVDQQILILNYGLTVARPSTIVLNPVNRKGLNTFLNELNKTNSNK